MSFGENLRRGRSHLITIAVLLIAGAAVVHIEDRELSGAIDRNTPPEPRRADPPPHAVKRIVTGASINAGD
jgi:hypothetical protein